MRRIILERLLVATLVPATTVLNWGAAWHRLSQGRHWEETETETIWRDRYTNCKYGYFVILPSGVIAHGSHSPAPNHGFLISLPDVAKTSEASLSERRLLWVNTEYNAAGADSLRAVANHQFHLARKDKVGLRVVERKSATLGGLAAVRFRFEYGSLNNRLIEDEVVALRSAADPIVYEVGLRTTQADYDHDNQRFEQIRTGLKLLSLTDEHCSSD